MDKYTSDRTVDPDDNEVCYINAIPEHCLEVDWFEPLRPECVNCVDARAHHYFYGLSHETSSEFARDSLLHTIDEQVPLSAVGTVVILVFFMLHTIQASNYGYGSFSSLLSAGNGYIFRFLVGLGLGYMILSVVSMYYHSHAPNFTLDTVNLYDRVLHPKTTLDAFITAKGRMKGWKSESNSFYDPLLLLFLIAFMTTWFQVFAPGLPLVGHHFVFFFSLLFLGAAAIFWERISGMGTMWFTDILVLIGVGMVASAAALGFYLVFYKTAMHYQMTDTHRTRMDSIEGLSLLRRYGIISQNYLLYALVLLSFSLVFYLAYYVQYQSTLGSDEYLIPNKHEIDKYKLYDAQEAINMAKSAPVSGLPTYVNVQCHGEEDHRVKIYAGSKYSNGSIEEQLSKLCASK